MEIEEISRIEELNYFSDSEILEKLKFKFFENELKPGFLIYKIKIGKLIFTVDIASEDESLIDDIETKRKIGNGAAKAVLQILRNKLNNSVH